MKRLALIVPEYRTDVSKGGGVASVADFLLTVFGDAPDWSVEVISPRMFHSAPENRRLLAPRTWFRGPTTSIAERSGTRVTYVGSDWAEFEFMRYRARGALTRALFGFDALLVVSGTPAVCSALSVAKVPVVAQVATFVSEERKRIIRTTSGLRGLQVRLNTILTSRVERRAVRIPSALLVENAWMLQKCLELGARNVEVHSPGVDTETFKPANAADNKPGYLLMVGRLSDPRKDLPTLLCAYKDARERHGVRQRLVLAGRNAPSASDVALIRHLGLLDYIEIRSGVHLGDLVTLYQEADLFLLTSEEEGLGVVLLEAMACGVPVIATATEGAKHIISGTQVGALVSFGTDLIQRFSDAVGEFALNVRLRELAGLHARQRAVQVFSVETAGSRFVEIMDELTPKGKGRNATGGGPNEDI